MEEAVLFLHILGVLLFVAGIVVAGVAFETARRQSLQPAETALILRLARVGVLLVAPGALLLLAAGLWLVGLADVGFDEGWVQAAIALFVLAAVLGGYGGRRPREARELAERLSEEGRVAGVELHSLLNDPRARAANYAAGLLVPVILALMVFKP
jgi:uncharacterized membrane protein